MSGKFEDRHKQVELKLKEIDNKSSKYIQLTEQEIVEIIGGSYIKLNTKEQVKDGDGDVCQCICNVSMCDFGACSQCDKPPCGVAV